MTNTNNTKTNKLIGCSKLVKMKKKKITKEDIQKVANEIGVSFNVMSTAWNNFQQSGGKTVDRRSTTGAGSIKIEPKTVCNNLSRGVSPETAGEIIRDYMTSDISSRALCNKHRISIYQFYGWIKELNIHGTVLGKKVLDPKKYAKIEITDVIWMRKNPETTRKSIVALTDAEKLAYDRVADILMMYLPKTKIVKTKTTKEA